jgi:hypothetical protein
MLNIEDITHLKSTFKWTLEQYVSRDSVIVVFLSLDTPLRSGWRSCTTLSGGSQARKVPKGGENMNIFICLRMLVLDSIICGIMAKSTDFE